MQITLLPAMQTLKIAAAHAAIPAENTTALEPCSSAAIFFSRIATVGLDALPCTILVDKFWWFFIQRKRKAPVYQA